MNQNTELELNQECNQLYWVHLWMKRAFVERQRNENRFNSNFVCQVYVRERKTRRATDKTAEGQLMLSWYSLLVAPKPYIIFFGKEEEEAKIIKAIQSRGELPAKSKPATKPTPPEKKNPSRHQNKIAGEYLIALAAAPFSIESLWRISWIQNAFYSRFILHTANRNFSKIDDVIEEVMKMEVLPVQNQFQGQFSVMGSSKIKGKQQENTSFPFSLSFTEFSCFPFESGVQQLFLDTFSILHSVPLYWSHISFSLWLFRFGRILCKFMIIEHPRERERKGIFGCLETFSRLSSLCPKFFLSDPAKCSRFFRTFVYLLLSVVKIEIFAKQTKYAGKKVHIHTKESRTTTAASNQSFWKRSFLC